MRQWNPRYLNYARAHQRDPEAMLAFDRERAPGGCMGPFIVWMSERWQEWRRANGRTCWSHASTEDHERFDAWLSEVVTARLALVELLQRRGQRLLFDYIADSVDKLMGPWRALTPEQRTASNEQIIREYFEALDPPVDLQVMIGPVVSVE